MRRFTRRRPGDSSGYCMLIESDRGFDPDSELFLQQSPGFNRRKGSSGEFAGECVLSFGYKDREAARGFIAIRLERPALNLHWEITMRHSKSILSAVAVASAIFGVGAASAADLPARTYSKAPAMVPDAVY